MNLFQNLQLRQSHDKELWGMWGGGGGTYFFVVYFIYYAMGLIYNDIV